MFLAAGVNPAVDAYWVKKAIEGGKMLLAVIAVIGALATPQPKTQTQPNVQRQPPARTSPLPGSLRNTQPSLGPPPPLCQTPGEVPPDGSVCDCPWGVGPEGQCLCPPEMPSPPPPCTGALRPPLPKPGEVLQARRSSLPDLRHSNLAMPEARQSIVWMRRNESLTPAGILRVRPARYS
jgi:hypothetical protein